MTRLAWLWAGLCEIFTYTMTNRKDDTPPEPPQEPPQQPQVTPPTSPAPTPPTEAPTVPQVAKYLWDTPANVRHSLRVICDEEGLTVAQKNDLCATVECESAGFHTDVVHPNYVIRKGQKVVASTDYGLCQWNDFYHGKEIPPDVALHDPEKAVRLMCQYFKTGRATQWVCYSAGLYKKYL